MRYAVMLALGALLLPGPLAEAAVRPAPTGGFVVEHELVLPGSPESLFDVMTGDILPWWDHHMSESPKSMVIEPKPGGRFLEIFDDAGNGVLHATVILANRGKLLRYTGPLGLSGNALDLVVTYAYEPHPEGTLLKVTCSAAGLLQPGWAEAVDGVWHHFLFERLKPHVESRAGGGAGD